MKKNTKRTVPIVFLLKFVLIMAGERRKSVTIVVALVIAVLVLFFLNLCWGTVHIPFKDVIASLTGGGASRESWDFIIRESRLPAAVTAMLAGASLAASGLMLQTGKHHYGKPYHRWVTLCSAGRFYGRHCGDCAGALPFGQTQESGDAAHCGYHGELSGIGHHISSQFLLYSRGCYCVVSAVGLLIAVSLIKPLNALLLGDMYAENLGVNIIRTRNWLLLSTSLLVAIITAYCGPVSFIGLAVPHIGRLMLQSSNHRSLMPVTILTGAVVALLCNVLSSIPGNRGLIPLNAITPAIGAPVILYVLLKNRHNQL